MNRKSKDQAWRREGGRRSQAEHDDEAMDYLLKPSLSFVAGLTLCLAIATPTAVAKIRIKQFRAIRLEGRASAHSGEFVKPGVKHENARNIHKYKEKNISLFMFLSSTPTHPRDARPRVPACVREGWG